MKKSSEVVKLVYSLMNDKSNYTARLQAESLVKEYARQKCKEQRHLCAHRANGLPSYEYIYNAPEPEFE